MKPGKQFLALAVLLILYTVGMVGTLAYGTDILSLTPVNLLVTAFITGLFHRQVDGRFVAYISIVFVAGFIIEAVGVATGSIFGWYFYGNNMGVKLFDTPIVIGLNWLVLSYCSSVWISNLANRLGSLNTAAGKALLATLVMVSIDVLIEQVAPLCDFWYWKNQVVPLQNYTAWFAFSFAFNYLFQRLEIDIQNPLAKWLLALQVVFFTVLNLFM
jgi:putative membrane protein